MGSFSTWDGIGLGVSLGFLISVIIGRCFWINVLHAHHESDARAPWLREQQKVGKPDFQSVDPILVELMQILDVDASGTISLEELKAAFDEKSAEFMFERFDQDKSGTLSLFELKQIYPTRESAMEAL